MSQNDITNISSIIKGKKISYHNTPILHYIITYPAFTPQGNTPAAAQINHYYQQEALEFILYCEETLLPAAAADYGNSIANGFPVHQYDAQWDYTITYNHNCIVSLYIDQYEYTGGAHGTTRRSSDTWNLYTGQKLSLTEILTGNNLSIDQVLAEIQKQIRAQLEDGSGTYLDNAVTLAAETFRPDQFYLTDDGIVFYFQQYDIAPYVSGIPEFMVPY